MKRSPIRWIPLLQGVYFAFTALWPLLHIRSFMAVTGDKTHIWLVKSVSVLILALSVLIIDKALRKEMVFADTVVIIIASGGLAMVEFIYFLQGTLKWVYLADAIIAILFMCWWTLVMIRARKSNLRNAQKYLFIP